MSPVAVPPGPLVPAFWIAVGFAVAFVAVLLLSGCSAAQSSRQCDEAAVGALVARCTALVKLECSPDPEKPCAAEDTCDAELAALCPRAVTP